MRQFVYKNRAVSSAFRLEAARILPGLGERQSYWRLLQYILFSDYRDQETGQLLLAQPMVAAVESKPLNSDYCALRFLNEFSSNVLSLEIEDSRWNPAGKGRCRSLVSAAIPPELEALVRLERRSAGSNRVVMATGQHWSWRQTAGLREAQLAEAVAAAAQVEMCPESRAAWNYLNSLKPNRFTKMLKHLEEAMEAAQSCAESERELNILSGLPDNPMPAYVPSAHTARLYTAGTSFLHLHRSLRKILTQDWITADLKSAQLAIVAKVWDVPEINEFLTGGESIWCSLCGHMGLDYTDDNKGVLKTALYAVTFGAGTKSLTRHFTQTLGMGKKNYDKFVSHHVIAALLETRERQFEAIVRNKGAHDACGRFVPLLTGLADGDYEYGYDSRRSVLACVAQSYEIKLLQPVFEMALAQQDCQHGFTVTTLLHDGITIDCHKDSDRRMWMDKISELVKAQADALGIITQVEYS